MQDRGSHFAPVLAVFGEHRDVPWPKPAPPPQDCFHRAGNVRVGAQIEPHHEQLDLRVKLLVGSVARDVVGVFAFTAIRFLREAAKLRLRSLHLLCACAMYCVSRGFGLGNGGESLSHSPIVDQLPAGKIDRHEIIRGLGGPAVGLWMVFDTKLLRVYDDTQIPVILVVVVFQYYLLAAVLLLRGLAQRRAQSWRVGVSEAGYVVSAVAAGDIGNLRFIF
jgi:hypothetical protein